MGKPLKSRQTLRQLGRSLAVRIPARVAKAVGFTSGQPITVEIIDGGIYLRGASQPRLSLEQMLQLFDPEIHGGEAMPYVPVGKEVL